MSAAEVIQQIEQLEPEERQEVISHFMLAAVAALRSSDGQKLLAANFGQRKPLQAGAPSAASGVTSSAVRQRDVDAPITEEFKAIAGKVFARNEELFRKLAQ